MSLSEIDLERPAVPDPPEVAHQLWSGFARADVAWDVGANCGQAAEVMRHMHAKVVCFEPAPQCMPYLRAMAHDPSQPGVGEVVARQVALSDRNGEVELLAIPDKISTGQLVTPDVEGMEWSGEAGTIYKVPSLTGDYLVSVLRNHPPGFVKIDVEGHEQLVLNGMYQIVMFRKPEMLIEIHSADMAKSVMKTLLDANYDVETVRHPHYEQGSLLWRSHMWYRCFPRR